MLGILFALLSALLLAANYVFIQLGMRDSTGKNNGVFLGIVINVSLLGLIYLIMLLIRSETIEWKLTAILAFIAGGLLTTLLGRLTLFSAIRSIGSSRAAAMKNAAPIFSILAAILFLNERLSLLSSIGILLVIIGLYFLARDQWKQNGSSKGKEAGVGFLLAGLSAFLYGIGQVARKMGLLEMADPVLGAWVGSIFALLAYVITLAFKGQLKQTFTTQVRKINKFYFLAGMSIGFGLLSFFISASLIKVSYTSAIAAAEPVITVILAYLFLKKQERLERSIILSILLVFAGIVVIAVSTL